MATVMSEVTLNDSLKDFDDDKEFVNIFGACIILFWLLKLYSWLVN